MLGCVVFRGLAVLLQRQAWGLAQHLTVAACTVGLVLAPLCLRALRVGAGLTGVVLALDGGFDYPDLIMACADIRSGGSAWSLMTGPTLAPPETRAHLMALTLAKDPDGPSDVLQRVATGEGLRLYRWSYRARSFVRAGDFDTRLTTPLCIPRAPPPLTD